MAAAQPQLPTFHQDDFGYHQHRPPNQHQSSQGTASNTPLPWDFRHTHPCAQMCLSMSGTWLIPKPPSATSRSHGTGCVGSIHQRRETFNILSIMIRTPFSTVHAHFRLLFMPTRLSLSIVPPLTVMTPKPVSATAKAGFECFNIHTRGGQGLPWEGRQHPQQLCCRSIQDS